MMRVRRGQAEVIGGLIILTILVALVLPIVIKSYNDVARITEENKNLQTRADIKLKEKLSIAGVRPEDVGPDLWPGLWINNTGTVQVTLRTLYLMDMDTGQIVAALDMANARPATSNLIDDMYLNPDQYFSNSTKPIPPPGEPITLEPGDKLYIVFNDAHPAMTNPYKLYVRVLSSEGVLHPIGGGGKGGSQLVPPKELPEIEFEPWKGAFSPYAGFKLIGGDQLLENGQVKAFRPSIRLTRPIDVDFQSTFIYDDNDNPGLYRVTLVPDSYIVIRTNVGNCYAWAGSRIELKGFIGTYHFYTDPDTGNEYVYIYGYAMEILRNGGTCLSGSLNSINPSGTYEVSDFDANGVDELVVYSLKNGPNYGYSSNPNADRVGDSYDDSLVWSYMVTRDISGQDFVRITAKVNYYWTKIALAGKFLSPKRDLRTFMVVVWEYDNSTDKWVLRHYKDFSYTSEKPKQYQFSTVFPLDRDKTYRVGILFFDNYRLLEEEGGHYDTALEFTYALEYLVVEYGRYNPLFSTTPPIYIVAIPDPLKIHGIGEDEYATYYGVPLSTAKVEAQAQLLDLVKQSLENAGLTDYIVITSSSQLCKVLFPSTSGLATAPPKYAVVIWLQGDKSIYQVSGCATDAMLKSSIKDNHWVFAQVSGEPLWGSLGSFTNYGASAMGPGNAALTSDGLEARLNYKAFAIPTEADFLELISVSSSACVIDEGTFYQNTGNGWYGTVSLWVECSAGNGVIVVNPMTVDWAEDGGGATPEGVAEIVTYAALEAYKVLLSP